MAVAAALTVALSAVASPAAAGSAAPVFAPSVPASIPIDTVVHAPLSVPLAVTPAEYTKFNVYYLDSSGRIRYGTSVSSDDGRANATVFRSGAYIGLTAVFEAVNGAGSTRSDSPRPDPITTPAATPPRATVVPPDVTLPPHPEPSSTPLAPTPPDLSPTLPTPPAQTPPPAVAPVITRQPIHAVGIVNSVVSVSVESVSPLPTTTVWWADLGGTATEIARGNPAKITLSADYHRHQFWAVVTDAAGDWTASEHRILAVVTPPKVTLPLPTATLYLGMSDVPVTVAATGGLENVAKVVAEVFVTAMGNTMPADRLNPPLRQSVASKDGTVTETTATQVINRAHPGSRFIVIWKTCVIVEGSSALCPVEVPNARTAPGSTLQTGSVPAPTIVGGLARVTTGPPGSPVALSVRVADPVNVTYSWEYSNDDRNTWRPAPGTSSSFVYQIGNVSAADRQWFRVTVSNDMGSATSTTEVREMRDDYSGVVDGYAPLWFANLTTDADGDQPIARIGSSGAWEVPNSYLLLRTGAAVKTSWHYSHAFVNEWFDMRIGAGPWVVRVQYNFSGVECVFRKETEPPEAGSTSRSPFTCLNGSQNDRFVGRNTPDDRSVLYLISADDQGRTRTLTGEAAATLAGLACSSQWVAKLSGCAAQGTASPGPLIVSDVTRVGTNCAVESAVQSFPRSVSLTRQDIISWSDGFSVSAGFAVEWKTGFGGVAFQARTDYNHTWGGMLATSRTDSYGVMLSLQPGQVGYIALESSSTVWRGDVTFMLGKTRYTLSDTRYVATNTPVGTGTAYPDTSNLPAGYSVATYIRAATQLELDTCRAQFPSAG